MFFSEAQRVPPLNNWNCAPPFLAPEVLPPLLIMLFFSFSLSPELIQVENTKTKIKIQIQIYLDPPAFFITPLFSIFSPAGVATLWWKMENGPKLHQFPKTFPFSLDRQLFFYPFPLFPNCWKLNAVEIQSRALWQSVHIHFNISRLSLKTTFANQFCKDCFHTIPHICHEPTSEARVNFFWPV